MEALKFSQGNTRNSSIHWFVKFDSKQEEYQNSRSQKYWMILQTSHECSISAKYSKMFCRSRIHTQIYTYVLSALIKKNCRYFQTEFKFVVFNRNSFILFNFISTLDSVSTALILSYYFLYIFHIIFHYILLSVFN